MLVAIAGIDGAGKSTLTNGLVDWLTQRGLMAGSFKADLFHNQAYERYRETLIWLRQLVPEIERDLRAALIVLEACRGIRTEIAAALQEGAIVICDRYLEGNFAYLQARNLPEHILHALSAHLPAPDLSIFLDISVETSVQRLRACGEYPNPDQIAFYQRVSSLYQTWSRTSGALVLDACLPPHELVETAGRRIIDLLPQNQY
jgi:dTMP kinase